MASTVCLFDELRSLAAASISGSYAAVGSQFSHMARLLCITNNTDGDMFFSTDGSTNQLFIPHGSFKLFDLTTNRENNSPIFVLPKGTQIYAKQSTAPTTGSVYVEVLYGKGD